MPTGTYARSASKLPPNDRRAQAQTVTGSETTSSSRISVVGSCSALCGLSCSAVARRARARCARSVRARAPDGFGSATACAASHFALPEESGECTGTGEHHGDNRRAHRPVSIPGWYSRIGSNAEVPVSGGARSRARHGTCWDGFAGDRAAVTSRGRVVRHSDALPEAVARRATRIEFAGTREREVSSF